VSGGSNPALPLLLLLALAAGFVTVRRAEIRG
jgi:MYXO-CTERM domain-containing protein